MIDLSTRVRATSVEVMFDPGRLILNSRILGV